MSLAPADLAPFFPPLARFALAMMLIFCIPELCRRLRVPAVVGFLAAGFLVGPHVLGIMPHDAEVAAFFSDIGKLLLMFFVGLEIDLAQFRRVRHRSMGFGLLTFALPMLAGTLIGHLYGYPLVGALVIGSLIASHTLIAYPIVEEAGQVGNEAVTVTVGATIFTDLGALLVLALCIPAHTTGLTAEGFALQVLELALFIPAVLICIPWLSRRLLTLAHSKGAQFAVTMALVALAALGAELINLEGIVGAFLAGLALNTAIRGTEAKHELEFIGEHLFIPIFFMTIGFLIDARVFAQTLSEDGWLVAGLVGGLIATKFLAAWAARLWFGYSEAEGLTMWALTLPQVAATLAAAIVAHGALNAAGEPLIGRPVVDAVIVLLVVTSVLGPVLTERFVRRLPAAKTCSGAPGARISRSRPRVPAGNP